jgi:hypothetical protein
MYIMPEVGALAWLCRPSSGKFGAPFLMGFQAPYDEDNASFRSGRQTLNPGDMMLRTRDENFIILRRGGVVQIGATPTAQRIYVPIRNFIQDFCENYQLFTFGGEMTWITERDDQTTEGNAPTKLTYKVKSTANEPEHVLELTMGSHGEDDPVKLQLQVYSDGTENRELKADLKITNEGDVIWDVEQDFLVNAKRDMAFITEEGNQTFECAADYLATAGGKMNLESKGDWTGASEAKAQVVGGTEAEIDAPLIKLGAGAQSEPVPRGQKLASLLSSMITQIAAFTYVPALAPAPAAVPVIAAPAVAALAGQIPGILSTKSFVE